MLAFGRPELDGGREVTVMQGATRAQFSPPDRLVFSKDGILHVVRFNPRTLRVSGEPVAIATLLPNLLVGEIARGTYFALSAKVHWFHLPELPQQPRGDLVLV
jgi:hypothetical protein